MKSWVISAIALGLMTTGAYAGDAAKGEADFKKKCRSCHTIASADEVIFKGGRTGPNLYNVVGRTAGAEDFKYSKLMMAANAAGLVWTEENLTEYLTNQTAYLRDATGESSGSSKMNVKVKDGENLAAYLASVSPGN